MFLVKEGVYAFLTRFSCNLVLLSVTYFLVSWCGKSFSIVVKSNLP